MLNKKFKFSTHLKISQIIEKLERITTGKSLGGKKKVEPYYLGEYDRSGFRFKRRHPVGDCIFSSKLMEQESKTDVFISIYIKSGTLLGYILIIALMSIVLFKYKIDFDLLKVLTLIIIFLIPILLAYISFRSDVRKAKSFLMELFQIGEASLLRDD